LEKTEQKESGCRNRRLTLMTDLVPSVPEIRYLIAQLLLTAPIRPSFILAWSFWRRKHQANAAIAHYKTRLKKQL
jgi:hypothetical protein